MFHLLHKINSLRNLFESLSLFYNKYDLKNIKSIVEKVSAYIAFYENSNTKLSQEDNYLLYKVVDFIDFLLTRIEVNNTDSGYETTVKFIIEEIEKNTLKFLKHQSGSCEVLIINEKPSIAGVGENNFKLGRDLLNG